MPERLPSCRRGGGRPTNTTSPRQSYDYPSTVQASLAVPGVLGRPFRSTITLTSFLFAATFPSEPLRKLSSINLNGGDPGQGPAWPVALPWCPAHNSHKTRASEPLTAVGATTLVEWPGSGYGSKPEGKMKKRTRGKCVQDEIDGCLRVKDRPWDREANPRLKFIPLLFLIDRR